MNNVKAHTQNRDTKSTLFAFVLSSMEIEYFYVRIFYMKNFASLVATILILLGLTYLTILYSDGYRINTTFIKSRDIKDDPANIIIRTGMLAVRSIPEGAKIYLNDSVIAATATDDTISSLKPGNYNIKLEKQGFETWVKDVQVYPELVTDITAVLILKSPRLEPLTNTDVKAFDLSNDQNKIAFIARNDEKSGIWILPLTGSQINLFKSDLSVLIRDNIYGNPSLGESLKWSPTDNQLLVKMNNRGYLLYDIFNQNTTSLIPKNITDLEKLNSDWQEVWRDEFLDQITETIISQSPPENIITNLENPNIKWSPDFRKFFYIENDNNEFKVIVYNSEDPLPVDEKRLYSNIKLTDTVNTKLYWYSDSYHFIVLEAQPSNPNYHKMSLIRIDGTNKTTIYNGLLASNQAYPTPFGDRIIVLTTLKEGAPNNLYAIAIR